MRQRFYCQEHTLQELTVARDTGDGRRFFYCDLCIADEKDKALAAHQAVVRELAEALTTLLEELGWSHAESENERRLLAHPLVAAARKGTA